MTEEPAEIPVHETQAARDEAYRDAEREKRVYVAIERYENEYGVTYDLLPAGRELSRPARKELETRLTQEVEEIIGDRARATVEVSKTLSRSLGSLSGFETEAAAREIARIVAVTVLDEDNWVEASPPSGSPETETDPRRN